MVVMFNRDGVHDHHALPGSTDSETELAIFVAVEHPSVISLESARRFAVKHLVSAKHPVDIDNLGWAPEINFFVLAAVSVVFDDLDRVKPWCSCQERGP